MEDREASGAVAFFKAMTQSFGVTLVAGRGRGELIDALTAQAFDFFEGNVAIQSEDLPDLACDKGCPACCTMRVTAAAPEIFLLARTIRRIHETESGMRLDLPRRIAEAHRAGAGLDDQHRIALKRPCPMILRGVCIVHPVRPLACRGHASFDKRACALAAAGRDTVVPISEPHFMVRSLVQNAMQSALREAGYAWRSYELNHALGLALTDDNRAAAWLNGADALAEALVTDVDWEAMGTTFDALQEDDGK
ncbi:MAG: hypothetical protein ACLQUZ_01670 [Rhizomicrobium sp.]